jgi:hypothetical protein
MMHSTKRALPLALVLALSTTATAHAAYPRDEATSGTEQLRNGAGLQVSSWQPDKPIGFDNTGTMAFQGYLLKGLDLHLAWDNTLGFWQRTTKWSDTQPIFGTTNHELDTYLVPTITALRLYPFTTPEKLVEPYMSAGVGPVFGIQQMKISGSFTPENTTNMLAGFGVRAGAGVDIRGAGPFGVTLGGHFESASFGEEMVGERVYQAWGADFGLTYRFQYR